jgi:hypothetical protein
MHLATGGINADHTLKKKHSKLGLADQKQTELVIMNYIVGTVLLTFLIFFGLCICRYL